MPFAKHFHIHQKSDQPTNVIMQPLCTYTRWLLFFLIQWRVIRYSRWYNQCQDSGKDLMQIPKQEKKKIKESSHSVKQGYERVGLVTSFHILSLTVIPDWCFPES